MKKTSIASLQERLAGWTSWDITIYQVGACLGFWPEFGAPSDATGPFDPWHGCKDVIWSSNLLGNTLSDFVIALAGAGVLEHRHESDAEYRWNTNYKGAADLPTILE